MEWPFYHGCIDRAEAERRLTKKGSVGYYLIRERAGSNAETQSYAYSLLSLDGKFIHARVDLAKNGVTIDGRLQDALSKQATLFDVVSFLNETRRKANLPVDTYLPRKEFEDPFPANGLVSSPSTSPVKEKASPVPRRKIEVPAVQSNRDSPTLPRRNRDSPTLPRRNKAEATKSPLPRRKADTPAPEEDLPILKSGRLCMKSANAFFGKSAWRERWAELTKNDLIIKNKTGVSVTEKARIAMGVTYSVGTCNTKLLNKKFVIVLTTKHGPVYLQSTSAAEARSWVRSITSLLLESDDAVLQLKYHPGLLVRKVWNCCGKEKDAAGCTETDIAKSNASGASGVIHSDAHVGQPWYVGKMKREECQEAVCSGDVGDFLVRDTSDGKNHVIVINDHGEPALYQVIKKSDGTYGISGESFVDIEDILEVMRKVPPNGKDGNPLPLGNVAPYDRKTDTVESLRCGKCGCLSDGLAQACSICGEALHEPTETDTDAIPLLPTSIYVAPLDEETFEKMDPQETLPEELPPYCRKARFNRYWDILPNPLTRVRLPCVDDNPESDYYNANFIRGYGEASSMDYIAAQGPLASCAEEFLRLVWHHRVQVIVMITLLREAGKEKCYRYWPEDDQDVLEIGQFKVFLTGSEYENGYVKNYLKISYQKKSINIVHFWFTTWPDHGVPVNFLGEVYPDNALALLSEARKLRDSLEEESPLLVHCSAGIGRTGTFITIDQVITAVQRRDKVDVNNIIQGIREDRMGLVQHTSQYKFAYQAAVTYARSLYGPETEVLTELDTRGPKKIDEQMRKDSMRKNGTWKLKELKGDSVVYALRSNAPRIRTAEDDKEVYSSKNEAPEKSRPRSPEVRRSLSKAPLSKQPWFRQKITRRQVEKLLTNAPEGSFIVRPSSQEGMYAISIQQGDHISNVLCIYEMVDGKKMFKFGDRGDKLFPSIIEMIEYFMQYPYTQRERTGSFLKLRNWHAPSDIESKLPGNKEASLC
eukprot:m.32870 g.32870  ORF g.32870 m.32870 type:complete len:988 (+) comp8459_c0_seq1:206-3169(+)